MFIGENESRLQSVIAEKPLFMGTKLSRKRVQEGLAVDFTRTRMECVLSEL
jgi:hypothetical protein